MNRMEPRILYNFPPISHTFSDLIATSSLLTMSISVTFRSGVSIKDDLRLPIPSSTVCFQGSTCPGKGGVSKHSRPNPGVIVRTISLYWSFALALDRTSLVHCLRPIQGQIFSAIPPTLLFLFLTFLLRRGFRYSGSDTSNMKFGASVPSVRTRGSSDCGISLIDL
jgi:hypothetical protein